MDLNADVKPEEDQKNQDIPPKKFDQNQCKLMTEELLASLNASRLFESGECEVWLKNNEITQYKPFEPEVGGYGFSILLPQNLTRVSALTLIIALENMDTESLKPYVVLQPKERNGEDVPVDNIYIKNTKWAYLGKLYRSEDVEKEIIELVNLLQTNVVVSGKPWLENPLNLKDADPFYSQMIRNVYNVD